MKSPLGDIINDSLIDDSYHFQSEYLFDPVLADINQFHISTSTLDGNMLTQGEIMSDKL